MPGVAFTDPGYACLAYRKLPGVPLLFVRDQLGPQIAELSRDLGEFLARITRIPADTVRELVPLEADSPDVVRYFAGLAFRDVERRIPPRYRPAIDDFVTESAPPAVDPVFSHNDLGIEHVLVDPDTWAVTGIIDWSDADLVDPAQDLGRILRDLGPEALEHAMAGYGSDSRALRDRAWFYARCGLLEDLEYGADEDQQAYVDKSLDGLDWLFA